MKNYRVLLYYYYVNIENPNKILEDFKNFSNNLNIKGRIIVAKEGINGTISGPKNDCEKHKIFVKKLLNLKEIDFKEESCNNHLFNKLSIKIKDEIIKIGQSVDPTKKTGIHLEPKEFKNLMKDKDTIILDVRSNMEHKLGKFKKALTFDINNMYELPDKLESHELFKNKNNRTKKILTYCTGGIKCEKASAFLINKGFKNVYQLKGGIIRYGMNENGENFDGKCYVFDNRIGIDINKINPKNISKCYNCEKECNTMINCMNTVCNRHTTMCKNCYKILDYCCCIGCSKSDTKRDLYINFFNDSIFK